VPKATGLEPPRPPPTRRRGRTPQHPHTPSKIRPPLQICPAQQPRRQGFAIGEWQGTEGHGLWFIGGSKVDNAAPLCRSWFARPIASSEWLRGVMQGRKLASRHNATYERKMNKQYGCCATVEKI
jgi:hypothetical protein